MPVTDPVNSAAEMVPPNVMVIFGGTGVLTRRKLFRWRPCGFCHKASP
jgi:hypothetical protein